MRSTARSDLRLLAPVVVLAAAATSGFAGDGGPGGDWPQFHGPRRDNVSTETGLLKAWPAGGPPLAWEFTQCGRGFSGVAVVGGSIYTAGDFGDEEFVLALDLDGKLLWKARNGRSWRGPYPGSRTTPTFDEGALYHLSPVGRLASFEAESGKEIWAVDLVETFGTKYGRWAMAENVLIDGDALLCVPGGTKGRVVALDKRTGETVWTNTEIPDGVAYGSPTIIEHGGVRQLVTLVQKSVVSVDVKTGEMLWRHAHETKHDQNITMPIFEAGRVFASSGHRTGGRLLEIAPDGRGVMELWHNKDLDNCHGGVLLLDGCLYGSGCRLGRKGFVCVDFETGKTLWNERRLGKVSITHADGLLYCLSDKGKMSLVDASRDGCRVVSRFAMPKESRGLWLSHPVVAGGRLYVRHGNVLFAYDVRGAARQGEAD